jgi:hypothetical protein
MTLLNKEDLLLKLSPYGVKSITELNRIIREQGLPKKSLTPRKVFFDEAEVDMWLARRNENVAQANIDRIKIQRAQRKARKRRMLPPLSMRKPLRSRRRKNEDAVRT